MFSGTDAMTMYDKLRNLLQTIPAKIVGKRFAVDTPAQPIH